MVRIIERKIIRRIYSSLCYLTKPGDRSDTRWRGFGVVYQVFTFGMAGSQENDGEWKNMKNTT